MTAFMDSVSYADMAAYTVALFVTVATLGALWVLGRCTLRTCVLWALALLVPVAFTVTASDDTELQLLERQEVGE